MKTITTLLLVLWALTPSQAQHQCLSQSLYKNVSAVRIDSTCKAQATVIEYSTFLVVLECPAIESSAHRKAGNGKETERGQLLFDHLQERYAKPVRYVLCSHGHAHTLSGVLPFLEAGAQIACTSEAWDASIKAGLLAEHDVEKYAAQLLKLDKDTTLLADTNYPIDLLYLDSTDYYYTPTDDYLMFYLRKDRALHASCVAWIKDLDYSRVDFFTYNGRLDGLLRVIEDKAIEVIDVIRLEHTFYNQPQQVQYKFTLDHIHHLIETGKTGREMITHLANMSASLLVNKQDSIIRQCILQQLHPNLLRLAAYDNLKPGNHSKALQLAVILNIYSPGSPKYLNALGECHYVAGNTDEAIYYNARLKRLAGGYGMAQWAEKSWQDE